MNPMSMAGDAIFFFFGFAVGAAFAAFAATFAALTGAFLVGAFLEGPFFAAGLAFLDATDVFFLDGFVLGVFLFLFFFVVLMRVQFPSGRPTGWAIAKPGDGGLVPFGLVRHWASYRGAIYQLRGKQQSSPQGGGPFGPK